MTTFVWDKTLQLFVDKKTREPMPTRADWKPEDILRLQPMIVRDVPPHIGPSGRYIGSRAEMREEMKRTDTVERDTSHLAKMKYLNPENAARNGQKFDREYAAEFKEKQKKALDAAGLLAQAQKKANDAGGTL